MRTALLLTAALAALAAAGVALEPQTRTNSDYMEYAAAARLFAAGADPYDARRLLAIQVANGSAWDRADMMWNPPWAMPLVAPLAAVPWAAGQALWAAIQTAALGAAGALLWPRVGGAPGRAWLGTLLAVFFGPSLILLRYGQVGGLVLLGLAGFAYWRDRRPVLAGVALVLTAIKPHLLLPFALLVALDSAQSIRSRAAAILGATLVALCALAATLTRPTIWTDYRVALNAPTDAFHFAPGDWTPPILSNRLRNALDAPLWAQFAPSVAASALLAAYWWRRRDRWDWGRELPVIVLTSMLTTGYGAWGFDAVLLLPAVLAAAARVDAAGGERGRLYAGAGYALLSVLMLDVALPVIWWAPVVALIYAASRLLPEPP